MVGRAHAARKRTAPALPGPGPFRGRRPIPRPAPKTPRVAFRATRPVLAPKPVETARPVAITLAVPPHPRATPIPRLGPKELLPRLVAAPLRPGPTQVRLMVVPDGAVPGLVAPLVPPTATDLLVARRATGPLSLIFLAVGPPPAHVAMEAHPPARGPRPDPRPLAPTPEAARVPRPVRDAARLAAMPPATGRVGVGPGAAAPARPVRGPVPI